MIPEFAYPTGLDDSMRQNFTTMKSIAQETNKNPIDKMKVLQSLIGEMQKAKVFKSWGIELGSQTHSVNGDKLQAGSLLMGNK